MFKSKNGWLGIDVGSKSIKLAQVKKDAHGWKLVRATLLPRPEAWPDDKNGALELPIGSQVDIQNALQCGENFSSKSVACILPMHLYDLRAIHLPSGSVSERRTMIASEMAEHWSAFETGCDFSFWETNPPGIKQRPEEININVLAVAKRWTHSVSRDIQKAGLRCMVIDGPPHAMARAIGMTHSGLGGKPVAVIDWGYTNCTFCVVAKGLPLYVRRFKKCGVRHLVSAIEKAMGVSEDQARYMIETYGFPEPLKAQRGSNLQSPRNAENLRSPTDIAISERLAQAAAVPLQKLNSEISRTLNYFQNQRRSLCPTKLWLTGGGASLPCSDEYLQKDVAIPVESWSLPSEATQEASGAIPTALFSNAIALSMLASAA